MGMEREDYLMIGIDVGEDKFHEGLWDDLENYSNPDKDIFYLLDGVSGEYFIIGHVIKWAYDYDGMEHTTFDTDVFSAYQDKVELIKDHVKKEFGIDEEPKIHLLTHWH